MPPHRILFAVVIGVAAAMYFFRLGRAGFDDAEAYSAYIASRKTLSAVLDANLKFDPGKGGGLYVLMLHCYCKFLGTGEIALRAFSAAFALVDVLLVYTLAADLFGTETALVAGAIWAVNPIALIVARWARMYSLYIALALGSFLSMRKLKRAPTAALIAMTAVVSAGMLYTHLGGALILASEAALLARERWLGRPVLPGCIAMTIAVILLVPIAPLSLADVRSSALGHRFDWIGSAIRIPLLAKITGLLLAGAVSLILVFGRRVPFDHAPDDALDESEPFRCCAIWSILPVLSLATGSMLFHPMFRIRYIAPISAGFAILGAAALGAVGIRLRNLAVVAIVTSFFVVASLFHFYHPRFELWREVARAVEAGNSPTQEVFFEAGYVMSLRQAAGLDPDSLLEALPDGYLRIPFDYYFVGPDPRRAINPFRPNLARDVISESARRNGGAWLVSHLNDDDVEHELPLREEFRCDRIVYDRSVSVSLFHIAPRDQSR